MSNIKKNKNKKINKLPLFNFHFSVIHDGQSICDRLTVFGEICLCDGKLGYWRREWAKDEFGLFSSLTVISLVTWILLMTEARNLGLIQRQKA